MWARPRGRVEVQISTSSVSPRSPSLAANCGTVTVMARWRHAVAIGFAAFGALLAVAAGGDPAALSIAMGSGLSAALGYWVGALLDRTRRSR